MRRLRTTARVLAVLLAPALAGAARAGDDFYLKDGDRVVFYGDSITDQRLYTTFVETYAVTRFPRADVAFFHSGWGGDRVTGGGGGPVDRRLRRDVFAYGPTVVTVMLGMNDASYRPFDKAVFQTYSKGYEHLVDSVHSQLPGVRMTLIVPSPYDDVTRKPNFEGGYNAVLLRYGEFVRQLAKDRGLDVADLNTPVVEATRKAAESDPKLAEKLNPDRVHPGPAGQLLMAAALLKAWHAPAVVTQVKVVAGKGREPKAEAEHARVTQLRNEDGKLSWTQLDDRLPFPIDLKDPAVALAVQSSDVVNDLDRQPLRFVGLDQGDYNLTIDGLEVGTFSDEQLEKGVNLATRATPMVEQARAVHQLTLQHTNVHQLRWRSLQVPYEKAVSYSLARAIEDLDRFEAEIVKQQRAQARPEERHYVLQRRP